MQFHNDAYPETQYAYLYHTLLAWLDLKLDGKSLGNLLAAAGVLSLSIYGAGVLGQRALKDLREAGNKVTCIIDRRADEFPDGIEGYAVMTPEAYAEQSRDELVLVTPEFHFSEIVTRLTEAGVSVERIISLSMVLEKERA